MTLTRSTDVFNPPLPADHPPYLNNTEPLEVEDTPLQLALLTMEVAEHRRTLAQLAGQIAQLRLDCGEF